MLDTRQILGLLNTEGIGRRTVHRLVEQATHAPETPSEMCDLLEEGKLVSRRYQPSPARVLEGLGRAETQLAEAERLGVAVIPFNSPLFPSRLLGIPDPPAVLFVKGSIDALNCPLAVAVVGTRRPSPFGAESSLRIAKTLANAGFVVISGLAEGCDTQAHVGCMDANGKTVAVLAHGLDTVYPKKNTGLAERIVASQGCLVSEYAPCSKTNRAFFVERDRLQSGLSLAVVVIETTIDGGTMHTAGFSAKQGRLLACVSHPPELTQTAEAQGNLRLMEEPQTIPLTDADSVHDLIERMKELSATDDLNGDGTANTGRSQKGKYHGMDLFSSLEE